MAISYRASTIVCDAGPNSIPGPVRIKGIVVSTGSVTISNKNGTIEVLQAGVYDRLEIQSSSTLTILGACVLHMAVK